MLKSISALALAFCVSLPTAALADTYWYCQFTPKNNQKLTYFSDAFGPVQNTGVGGNTTGRRMTRAMKAYMADKYSGMDGFPGCAYFDSVDKAKADLKRNEGLVIKNGGKFIAIDWRFTGP
jgi:hypothetical protein